MANNNQRNKPRKNGLLPDYSGQHPTGQIPIPPHGPHNNTIPVIYNMQPVDAGHVNPNQYAPQFRQANGQNPTMRFRAGEVHIEHSNNHPAITTIHRFAHPNPSQTFPPPTQQAYGAPHRPPPMCNTSYTPNVQFSRMSNFQGYQSGYPMSVVQPMYVANQQPDYLAQQIQQSSILMQDVPQVALAQHQTQQQQCYKSKRILRIVDPKTQTVTNEKEVNENEALIAAAAAAAASEKQRVPLPDVHISKVIVIEQPKDSTMKTSASHMLSLKVAQSIVADADLTPAISVSVPPQSGETVSMPPPSLSAPPTDANTDREEVEKIISENFNGENEVKQAKELSNEEVVENVDIELKNDASETVEKTIEVILLADSSTETENKNVNVDNVSQNKLPPPSDRIVDIVLEETEKEGESPAEMANRKMNDLFNAINAQERENRKAFDERTYDRPSLLLLKDWTEAARMQCIPTGLVQLKELGIDIRSAPPLPVERQRRFDVSTTGRNLYPPWYQVPDKIASKPKAYHGRLSDRGSHSNQRDRKRVGAVSRPSIDRPNREPVELHKSERAWKRGVIDDPMEQIAREVRELLNKITPSSFEALSRKFLEFKATLNPILMERVINIIFEKAVDEPKFCPLYCELLKKQVIEEERTSRTANFRAGILSRCQICFETKGEKAVPPPLPDDVDDKKREELIQEAEELKSKERRRNFGNIAFIGQLYRQELIVPKILNWCVVNLMKTNEEGKMDEDNVECVIKMLETVGPIADKIANEKRASGIEKTKDNNENSFTCEVYFEHLKKRMEDFTGRIRFLLMNLIEARNNNWVRREADGPKKIEEVHDEVRKEEIQNKIQRDQYEKKRGIYEGRASMEKRKPTAILQRQSQDGRNYGRNNEARDHKVRTQANLAASSTQRKNQSLTSVDQPGLLGARRPLFSGGSCGGGVGSQQSEKGNNTRDSSSNFKGAGRGAMPMKDLENRNTSQTSRKQSRDEGKSDLASSSSITYGLSSTERVGHVGIAASGSSPSLLSLNVKGSSEVPENVIDTEKLLKPVEMDILEYLNCDVNLDEVTSSILRFSKKCPIRIIFKQIMKVGVESVGGDVISSKREKVGELLCRCLQQVETRDIALSGVSDYIMHVIDVELWDEFGYVWEKIAEIITRSISCGIEKFDGARPSLRDFKEAFMQARKYESKPNILIVTVLKRLAQIEYEQEKQVSTLGMAFDEIKDIKTDSLMNELNECRLSIGKDMSLKELLN